MKKVLAKSICILMMLSLLVGVLGCAAEEPAATPDESAGVRMYEGVTLNIIGEQQTPSIALQEQLGEFEELTGIKVNLELVAFENLVQKITLAMQSGSDEYDIVGIPYQFMGNFVVNDYIQPLEPYMSNESLSVIEGYNEDDIIKGMWESSAGWKGEIYGMAANSCIKFMVYRKDLFENADEQAAFKAKYGYDLVVPTDWDTYRDVAEFFTRKSGETLAGETLTHDFYGVAMTGKRHDAVTCEWLNYAWSFGGGIFDDDGNLIINNEKNLAALTYYNDLKQFAPPGVTSKTWDEVTNELAQGLACMSILFNDCAPALEDPESSAVVGKMGYTSIPIKEKAAAHLGAWGYVVPKNCPNPEAAWLFLQWFNSAETQKAMALKGAFPNLVSVYEDPDLNELPYWEASKAAYEISTTRPRIPEWNEMNEELMLQISNVLGDLSTPEEALAATEAKYEELLAGQLPIDYQ